jgi:uncharacterized protein YlxW (UPF0749 family)
MQFVLTKLTAHCLVILLYSNQIWTAAAQEARALEKTDKQKGSELAVEGRFRDEQAGGLKEAIRNALTSLRQLQRDVSSTASQIENEGNKKRKRRIE